MGDERVREALGRAREVVLYLRYLELYDNVLSFDRWQACPPPGFDFESEASGFLERLLAAELTGPYARAAVDALRGLSDVDFPGDIDRGVARYLIRRHDEASRLPTDLVEERTRMNADARRAWEACCREDDFAAFASTLERAFDLDRRMAEAIDPDKPVYQVLDDQWDPSYTVAELDAYLGALKREVPRILEESREAWADVDGGAWEAAERERTSAVSDALCAAARVVLGADPARIRPFKTHHPVTVCAGPRDARPSTFEDGTARLLDTVLAMAHETGHACTAARARTMWCSRASGAASMVSCTRARAACSRTIPPARPSSGTPSRPRLPARVCSRTCTGRTAAWATSRATCWGTCTPHRSSTPCLSTCRTCSRGWGEGDSSGVCGWLREHVWRFGQTYTASETLCLATGADLDVDHYLAHLRRRFCRT